MSATVETQSQSGEERTENVGRIEEVQGVVIEAVFSEKLPEINHAIKVRRPDAARAEEDVDTAAAPPNGCMPPQPSSTYPLLLLSWFNAMPRTMSHPGQ